MVRKLYCVRFLCDNFHNDAKRSTLTLDPFRSSANVDTFAFAKMDVVTREKQIELVCYFHTKEMSKRLIGNLLRKYSSFENQFTNTMWKKLFEKQQLPAGVNLNISLREVENSGNERCYYD